VARRRKRLVDLVRDETFLARKDEHLLRTPDKLPWPELERLRRLYVATPVSERREVALELERGLREDGAVRYLGELRAELDKLGPRDSFQRLERFFPRFFRHYEGPAAGKPYRLAPNHHAFLREFWRRDRHGNRIYQVGLLMEPKGNGKTPLTAGLGTYTLVDEVDAPNVYAIAGAKFQANFCHGFAKHNIDHGPLAAWLSVARESIACEDNFGEFDILSAEGEFAAGANPSAGVFDELFLFRHQHQREAWNSQVEALHKRPGRAWVLGISTAGWDKQTLLGERYDAALEHPKLEISDDGFHLVLRDEKNGFLFWCHEAPQDADIEDPAVIRRVNPAPWVRPRDLIRGLHQPGTDELDWRRLHANQWTKTKQAWLASGVWARLRGDTQIPEGAEIYVGIDAARTWDTTSVGWLWIDPETGRKVCRAHIWSVRKNVPHHTFVDGGELVNEELVEPFVYGLDDRYRVRAIALDPRYLNTEAKHLADAGHVVIKVEPFSNAMRDAVTLFEKDALARALEHDGDRAVSGHIEAIDSVRGPDGAKKIGKRNDGQPIDAGISMILADYLTTVDDLPERERPEPWVMRW
jgi:phage terminase large subunit-like protein